MRCQDRRVFDLYFPFFCSSVALVMQVCIPILAFAKKKSVVSLRGGTNADFAPPVDYMMDVTSFYYQKFGMSFHTEIRER